MTNKDKLKMKVPCAYLSYNEVNKRDELRAPSVDCTMGCDSCGWNPREAERRMKTGVWVLDNGRMKLCFRNGE